MKINKWLKKYQLQIELRPLKTNFKTTFLFVYKKPIIKQFLLSMIVSYFQTYQFQIRRTSIEDFDVYVFFFFLRMSH